MPLQIIVRGKAKKKEKDISLVLSALKAGWDTSHDIAEETGIAAAEVAVWLGQLRDIGLAKVVRRNCGSWNETGSGRRFHRWTAFLLAAITAFITPALARDDGRYAQSDPGIKEWIRGLKNSKGEGCCDTADGYPAEVQYDTAEGQYRVRIDGAWYIVPDHAVITKPNRLGYAVVWYIHIDGVPQVKCFIPGGGT